MIQHILKIIWTERRINFWILLELLIIFCIIWFCTDYFTFMCRRYLKPTGFDIENTYMVEVSQDAAYIEELVKNSGQTKDEILNEYGWLIYERVKQYSDVLAASLSVNTYPYNGGMNSSQVFVNNDTIPVRETVYDRRVSPEFFDVFRIKFISGKTFNPDDINRKVAIINGDENNTMGGHPITEVNTIRDKFSPTGDARYDVIGVLERTKRDPFYRYENEAYRLIDKSEISYLGNGSVKLCIRTKDNVDPNTFVKKFTADMYDQLNVGVFYLVKVVPFESIKEKYMFWANYSGMFKNLGAVVIFLLANIFLGLIGTFWFRSRQRRSEIGLRMAIGSSQSGVKRIFIGETLLLVTIACIIGAFISFNIGISDILREVGFPMARDRNYEIMDWLQYSLNFGVTFFIIATVSTLAVWYPARQVAKTQPADALRDE